MNDSHYIAVKEKKNESISDIYGNFSVVLFWIIWFHAFRTQIKTLKFYVVEVKNSEQKGIQVTIIKGFRNLYATTYSKDASF